MKSLQHFLTLFLILNTSLLYGQSLKIAVLKYAGGGDWYANPTSLPNLIRFCNDHLPARIHPEPAVVEPSSPDIFNYPFIHATGHGNIFFTDQDVKNLRKYLLNGGFLHIDDNYGMDPYARREIQKLFPDKKLELLPDFHPIFQQKFPFKNIPKIHEHDGKPAQAFAITHNGRIVLLYTYETDLGNGWEDQEVHNNPEEVRLRALKMGCNILQYVFERAL
ncbi:MAG: DUF4159 domain-containing protein [Thermaurantimonas sp.]|uniref:DUF4159 domain-containing protein n=1 Tax=Thermaurantimonas sp. TaxID=2681568 RepID=UPI00391D59EB